MWTLRNQSDIAKALLHSNQASFLKIYFLIAGKLLYNIVLVSGTQHRESVIIIYIYVLSLPLLTPTHPTTGSSQWAPGWVLCAAYSHFQQTIYFTQDSSYVSMLLSQFVPPSSSPAVSTRLFSIFTSLFLPCI